MCVCVCVSGNTKLFVETEPPQELNRRDLVGEKMKRGKKSMKTKERKNKLNRKREIDKHKVCVFLCTYVYICVCIVCVCSCAVTECGEERAEGVHCGSLCSSDCPLLWESGNSTLLSRGLVTRWERRKEKGKNRAREGELQRCGERERNRKETWKKRAWGFGHESRKERWKLKEAEREKDQEMSAAIGRNSLRKNKQREAQICFKSHKTPKMDDQSITIPNKFQNVLHAMLAHHMWPVDKAMMWN